MRHSMPGLVKDSRIDVLCCFIIDPTIKKKLNVSISNSSLKIFKRVLNAYVMNTQLEHIGESEWEIMVVEVNGGEPIEIPTMSGCSRDCL